MKNLDIQENLPIGSEIFKFEAYDADVGVNSALKYRIVSSIPSEAKRLLSNCDDIEEIDADFIHTTAPPERNLARQNCRIFRQYS
jgi:hypothetical protein